MLPGLLVSPISLQFEDQVVKGQVHVAAAYAEALDRRTAGLLLDEVALGRRYLTDLPAVVDQVKATEFTAAKCRVVEDPSWSSCWPLTGSCCT